MKRTPQTLPISSGTVVAEQISAYSGELQEVKQQYSRLTSLEGVMPTITLVNPAFTINTATSLGVTIKFGGAVYDPITPCPINTGTTFPMPYIPMDVIHQGIYLGSNVIVGSNYSGLSSHILPYNIVFSCDVAIKKTREDEIAELWAKFKKTRNVNLYFCIRKIIADKKAELNRKIHDLEFGIKELAQALQYIFLFGERKGYKKVKRFLFKSLNDDSDGGYLIEDFFPVRLSISNHLNKKFYEEEKYKFTRYKKTYSRTQQDAEPAQAQTFS